MYIYICIYIYIGESSFIIKYKYFYKYVSKKCLFQLTSFMSTYMQILIIF